jgi:predicted permease
MLPADFPRAADIHVNAAVFAFTLLIALATGVLFGLAPALQAARTDLQQTLRESGRGSTGSVRQLWLRNALVVGEVSLACILLIGAGLMLRSFVNMLRTDPGFRPQHVLTAGVSLPYAKYKTGKERVNFYNRLVAVFGAIPGVRSAGIGSDLPWSGYDDNISGFAIEGRQPPPHHDFHARYHVASENYFQALGIPLVRGRYFTPHDDIHGPLVVIINRVMARMYWGTDDIVGGRISFEEHPKETDWLTVAGVVGDVKDRPNSAAAEPSIWWPIQQSPFGFPDMSIVVLGRQDPAQLVQQVSSAVRSLDPELAVANPRLMDQVAGRSFSTPRFTLFLISLFAALAAILAAIGIYGVISYSVNQRTHEFGLRMALGAKPWDVERQVMRQGIRLALIGTALGIAGGLALGRVLWSLLYQVSADDPATLASVGAASIVVAALACYIPARRATTVDPMTALRTD